MHSRILRFTVAVCVALSAGVLTNVFFLQNHKNVNTSAHLSWNNGAINQQSLFQQGSRNRQKIHSRNISPSQPPVQLVRAIQRELAERKYYGGRLDGSLSLYTRAAIMDYEATHLLPLKGLANEDLLRTILLGASLETVSNGSKISPEASSVIRHAQSLLKRIGFKRVDITGVLDSTTLSAIRQFEFRHKLPPKGRISYNLIKYLERTASTKTSWNAASLKQD